MPQGRFSVASALRRSYLGAGAAGIAALVLSLGAVLDLFDADAAVEGTIVLALVVAGFYAAIRSGYTQRFADPGVAAAQLAAGFLYLGYLTFRTGDAPAAVSMLYALLMLYGVMRLDPVRLGSLAALGVVAHGTALFMLIDRGEKLDLAAAWTQFGAIVLTLAGFTFAAATVQRLRLRLAEAQSRLLAIAEEARDKASRDELTGAYHRRHLLEALEREVSRAERTGKPLSVARVDVDRMRSLNEAHGFAAGDAVLRKLAEVVFGMMRDVDVFGRYGGREFLLIMPDTALEGAVIAGERLRAAVNAAAFDGLGAERRVTCSSGLAQRNAKEGPAALLARAEACLTYAKAAGGDRVVALHDDARQAAAG
jgi:diguanylate cyclase (GGDEF)-like protein